MKKIINILAAIIVVVIMVLGLFIVISSAYHELKSDHLNPWVFGVSFFISVILVLAVMNAGDD